MKILMPHNQVSGIRYQGAYFIMISILCPCYNEEAALKIFFPRVIAIMDKISEPFEIICVNDGSKDNTLEILKNCAKNDNRIKVLDLSRNFG